MEEREGQRPTGPALCRRQLQAGERVGVAVGPDRDTNAAARVTD